MKLTTCILGAALAAMAACGPLSVGKPGTSVVGMIAPSIGGGDAAAAPAAAAAPQPEFNRAFIEAQQTDLLLVTIVATSASDVLTQVGTNGDRETWMNSEGVSLSFRDGLLIGSRGLGDDLMGADIAGAAANVRRGGTHTRTLEFLTGLGQIETMTFSCTTRTARTEQIEIFERMYQTTVMEESCAGSGQSFTNTYWRDGSGVIWQSSQWISPLLGYLAYQRL